MKYPFIILYSMAFLLFLPQLELRAEGSDCRSIQDRSARLECYDKSTLDTPPDEKTATTTEVVAAKPSDPARKVDSDDLAIAPNKFTGKNIEISKAQCFYADKNEYRCLANSQAAILMVVATDIIPEVEKQKIENECGEIKKMILAVCRRTLRLIPKTIDHDMVGIRDRTVVGSLTFEIVTTPSVTRRK